MGAAEDDVERGAIEVQDAAGDLGGVEERAGVREPGVRADADEPLVADDPAGRQVDDRLVDGAEGAASR